MKKQGFTLAEVLITLGIIGVVAALTMPALMQNVGGSKVGPKLAKFVNTIEIGTETLLAKDNVNQVSSVAANAHDTFLALSKYVVMTDIDEEIAVLPPSGSGNGETVGGTGLTWQLKDGTLMMVGTPTTNDKYNSGGAYQGPAHTLIVDIGGIDGRHRAGKEVFKFMLDESGILVPYGGKTHRKLSTTTTASLLENFFFGSAAYAVTATNNGSASYGDRAPNTTQVTPGFTQVNTGITQVNTGITQVNPGFTQGPPGITLGTCDPTSSELKNGYACTGAFADNGWQSPANY